MTRARIAECRDAIEEATSSLLDVDADLADLLAATEPAPKSDALALQAAALRLSLDLNA
jgi:hypothetical protein